MLSEEKTEFVCEYNRNTVGNGGQEGTVGVADLKWSTVVGISFFEWSTVVGIKLLWKQFILK